MDTSSQKTYKRRIRSVLIHKPIQREFTLVVLSLLIVSALTIGFVIHSTIRQALMGGGYRFGTVSPYEVMTDISYDLIFRVSLILFATIFVIVIFGVLFLHRVAGPVYRFQSVLRRVVKGEIPDEFRLREGDFFSEAADDLNKVLKHLKDNRERLDNIRVRLDEAVKRGTVSPNASVLNEIKESINKLTL